MLASTGNRWAILETFFRSLQLLMVKVVLHAAVFCHMLPLFQGSFHGITKATIINVSRITGHCGLLTA